MFLRLPFAISFSVFIYIYMYICIIIRDNVTYEGFRVLDSRHLIVVYIYNVD